MRLFTTALHHTLSSVVRRHFASCSALPPFQSLMRALFFLIYACILGYIFDIKDGVSNCG